MTTRVFDEYLKMVKFADSALHWYIYVIMVALSVSACLFLLIYHCYQYYINEISHKSSKNGNYNNSTKSSIHRPPLYKTMSILTIVSVTGFTITIIQGIPALIWVCNRIPYIVSTNQHTLNR